MKNQRNHSQLKEQEKSHRRVNNETDLTSLQDNELKKEVIKMLKEMKILSRKADHSNKKLETIKRNQSKLDNSIAEIKTDLKAMNNTLNNEEE